MTYEPDTYMSQPDGMIVLEEHIRYVKNKDGNLVKHITTRRFQGKNDYIDSQETTVLSTPDW